MHSNDNDPLNRTQAPPSGQASGQGATVTPNTLSDAVVTSVPREGFLTGSFVWMFVGVLLSAAAAVFVMNNEGLRDALIDNLFIVMIAQLGLVLGLGFLIARIPPLVALGLFFVYALSMGLVLGVIVEGYVAAGSISAVVSAFLGAAAIFGGAAFYGFVTKRDLTSLGGILFMGLIGLIVVMIVQVFFFAESNLLNLGIGIVGVLIFTGLTAWDVQRLKNGQMQGINRDSATVMGALVLYLDFINIFLFMLRIVGGNR